MLIHLQIASQARLTKSLAVSRGKYILFSVHNLNIYKRRGGKDLAQSL